MIGSSSTRTDCQGKMDGTLRYTADIPYEGMLHGVIVRAPLAHGRLKAITRGPGVDWSRVVFATAADIPGQKNVQMISADMPFLATDEVLYRGEPVALIAAPTLAEAEAARRAVTVEMEALPVILTLEEQVRAHQEHPEELFQLAHQTINKEDAAAALAQADIILEDCYTTPHQEQAYLEPNVMTAIPEAQGRMRVEGSCQCPYYVAPAVAAMLGTDLKHLHVRGITMGGAFGGKEDFPSQLGGHAALLAHLSGKPVRMALSRAEDMATTPKRHPSWVRIRAGAKHDGTLCGVEIDIVFDGGAYVTMSPVVLSRGAIHAAGAYTWPAVAVNAVAYRSNTPPSGAFRGFGVPQTIFAIESHMDQLARACNMTPYDFRKQNRLQQGHTTATCQTLRESVSTREVLDEILAATEFKAKHQRWGLARRDPEERIARGIGLALFWHGGGFTGGGEAKIAARVALDLNADGKAHVRVSSTEMGQGAHTVLAQIAADELGVPLSAVVCDPPDTALVPNSGPTVASRTTMIVGSVVQRCARSARERLLAAVAQRCGLEARELTLSGGVIRTGERPVDEFVEALQRELADAQLDRWCFEKQYQQPSWMKWDEATHRGDAYATYAWGSTVVEVEVDLDTFEVHVPRVTTCVDIGRAINPVLAQGQVEGATLQALGYALSEEVGVGSDGAFLRDRFQTYILPTTMDTPEIEVRILENPFSLGPGGAKGLGELPLHGAGPAVANALEHALGIRLKELPLTPEKIFAALKEAR